MPMTADLSDESLLFQTVRDVTQLFYSRGYCQQTSCNTIVALKVRKI